MKKNNRLVVFFQIFCHILINHCFGNISSYRVFTGYIPVKTGYLLFFQFFDNIVHNRTHIIIIASPRKTMQRRCFSRHLGNPLTAFVEIFKKSLLIAVHFILFMGKCMYSDLMSFLQLSFYDTLTFRSDFISHKKKSSRDLFLLQRIENLGCHLTRSIIKCQIRNFPRCAVFPLFYRWRILIFTKRPCLYPFIFYACLQTIIILIFTVNHHTERAYAQKIQDPFHDNLH